MNRYLYPSVFPEALAMSQLPPNEFGNDDAVGDNTRVCEQAIFFDFDPDLASRDFYLEAAEKRCVVCPDGQPKGSVYRV